MSLPNLKELNKIIALCRKQGVKVIKIGDIELTLGDTATKPSGKIKSHETQGEVETDGWETLSPEEKMFWSTSAPTAEKEDAS